MLSPDRQGGRAASTTPTAQLVQRAVMEQSSRIRPRVQQHVLKGAAVFSRDNIALDTEFFDPYRPVLNDQFGESELIKALRTGQKRLFLELYGAQAASSKVNQFMYNVYVYGRCFSPQLKIPQYLGLVDSSGKNILHYAAAGDVNLAEGFFKQLIPRFAGRQDSRGITALMLAAVHGNVRATEALRPYEAGLQDINGTTALMCAAKYRQHAVVEVLMPHEATILDKNNFTFVDYFPRGTEDSFLRHVNKAMQKYFKGYQVWSEATVVVEKPAPPDFKAFCTDLLSQDKDSVASIQDQITQAKSSLDAATQGERELFFTEFTQYYQENCLQKVQQALDTRCGEIRGMLDSVRELTNTQSDHYVELANAMAREAHDTLIIGGQQAMDRFKPNIERLHLLIQYETSGLYDEFEGALRRLSAALSSHKDELLQHLRAFNEATARDATYGSLRAQAQEMTAQYLQYSDSVESQLKEQFETALKEVHDTLDLQVSRRLEEMRTDLVAAARESAAELARLATYKQVKQIPDQELAALKQWTLAERQNQTLFPDTETFKMLLTGLYMTASDKGALDYKRFVALYQTALEYFQDDGGLLDFLLQTGVLPKATFVSYQFIENYFDIFSDSPYKITVRQFKAALQTQLVNQFTYKLEAQLVAHCRAFYDPRAQRLDIQPIKATRHGSLSRQRIYNGDQITQPVDINFAWFYLAIVGLVNRCECIRYIVSEKVTGEQLLRGDEYCGTYGPLLQKKFQEGETLKYSCIAPGWLRVVGDTADVIVDSVWEVSE